MNTWREHTASFLTSVLTFLLTFTLVVCEDETGAYVPQGIGQVTMEYEQMKDFQTRLFDQYDNTIRPRHYLKDPVDVNLTFVASTVLRLDTTKQTISVSGYFKLVWKDELLTWNKFDEGKTDVIYVRLSKIWYPRLTLKNAPDTYILGHIEDTVQISDDGLVRWSPSGKLTFQCDSNVRYYPFDKQRCVMQIYASETSSGVTIAVEGIDLSEYERNGEWFLESTSAHSIPQQTVPTVDIEFVLKRRTEFFVFTMMFPLLCLSILNCMSYLVPVESGEKGSLSITIFLSYAFFITYVTQMLPNNSKPQIALYVIYLCIVLLFSVTHFVYVTVESRVYHSIGTKPCTLLKRVRYRKKRQVGERQVEETNRKVELKTRKEITWEEFLRRLDAFMCGFCIVSFLLITLVFGMKVINNE